MFCLATRCTRELRDHETDLYLCLPCVRMIRSWLAELPNQMLVLRASTQREITGSPTRGGTKTPPLPGRLDTLNLCGPCAPGNVHDPNGDQDGPLPVAATLGSWVRLCCEELRLDPPLPATEEALASWLDERLSWLVRQPFAGEAHQELGDMMRVLRAITHVRPARRPVPRPCPRCSCLTLSETDWQPYIECGNADCEALWTQAELAADAEQRAAQVAAA
ncbi:hypothetical protein [Streptomyces sp. NPDC002402]